MLPHLPQDKVDQETIIKEIELIVIEMEGGLTDGTVTVDHQGNQSVSTCRADAVGLAAWLEQGGKAVVTARDNLPAAEKWCEIQGLTFRKHLGEKASLMHTVMFENEMGPVRACYLANDLDDLPAMMIAGLSAATAEAPIWVRDAAHLVLKARAGNGAVRELIDFLLGKKGNSGGL